MAKYDVTYTCGHTGVIGLVGPGKQREWRLEREAEKLCPECWEAEKQRQREEENRAAAEAAKEQELPALTGTDKQIAWAETIRQKLLERIGKSLSNVKEECKEDAMMALDRITQQASSSWWIDHRHIERMREMDELLMEQIKAAKKENETKEPVVIEASVEATVRPENPKTETVAEIKPLNNAIEVYFPEKREDFRNLIKEQLYEWSGTCWRRELPDSAGTLQDRSAEIGNILLASGYITRIYDVHVREMAINGTYEPEHTRWIKRRMNGEYERWFAIWWREDDGKIYNAARRLPRSKWSKPSVVVPPEMYEEVLDFAERYGFRLNDKAQETADMSRATKEATLTAKVTKPKREIMPAVSTDIPVLSVPEEVEIDAELRDDD